MSPKKIDQLLIEKAINKAKFSGDSWNAERFKKIQGSKLTDGERNDLNVYLFGTLSGATVQELKDLP